MARVFDNSPEARRRRLAVLPRSPLPGYSYLLYSFHDGCGFYALQAVPTTPPPTNPANGEPYTDEPFVEEAVRRGEERGGCVLVVDGGSGEMTHSTDCKARIEWCPARIKVAADKRQGDSVLQYLEEVAS